MNLDELREIVVTLDDLNDLRHDPDGITKRIHAELLKYEKKLDALIDED